MAQRDPNAVDLSQVKVRLADDVVIWPVRERGERVYRLEIPAVHRFYRVGYEEYVFISLLDGNTTVPQACGLAAAKLGNQAPTANQAASIQRWLLKNELAHTVGKPPPVRDPRRVPGQPRKSIISHLNPFWLKFPLCKDGRWFRGLGERLAWMFSTVAVLIGLLVIALGLLMLLAHWGKFTASTSTVFSTNNWMWLLLSWVALKIIHELGHATCCHRHGGQVHELGVVFILFAPLAYVDVTSCWRMPNRWRRIAVAAAGMFVELVIAAVAVFCWATTESAQVEFHLYNLIFAAGISTLLFNANALMRFDGYFMLADLIDIPNLYGESSLEIRRLAKRLILGQRSAESHYRGWRLRFIRVYGCCALLWRVVICTTLAIAASTMFAGAGIALAIAGIGIWLGQPLLQLFKFARQTMYSDHTRFIRGCIVSALLCLTLISAVSWAPIPTSVRAAVVAAYEPETLVRSKTDGFVRKVHVTGSAMVRQGDLLLELENPELSYQLQRLQIELQQNEIRQRVAIDQHDASAQLVLKEHAQSLRQQIGQLAERLSGLRLVAARNGQVIARNLDQMVGKYVHEGDVLLTIAQPTEKELIAVVQQEDIRQLRDSLGQVVPIRQADFSTIRGTIERIEPRATHRLPEPSLSALEGGPLAVQQAAEEDRDDDEVMRLIHPHFPVRIKLDDETAKSVAVGMRMEVAIGYRTDPLLTRLTKIVRRMWHQAQGEI